MIGEPYDLFSNDELDTLNWTLSQTKDSLSTKADSRCHLMYCAFQNFLKIIIEIESDKAWRDRRWDIHNKNAQMEKNKQRMKFMYVYQDKKKKLELEKELDDY